MPAVLVPMLFSIVHPEARVVIVMVMMVLVRSVLVVMMMFPLPLCIAVRGAVAVRAMAPMRTIRVPTML